MRAEFILRGIGTTEAEALPSIFAEVAHRLRTEAGPDGLTEGLAALDARSEPGAVLALLVACAAWVGSTP